MRDLIERLQSATGPDRELDEEIACEVGAYPANWDLALPGYTLEYYMTWSNCAPTYTASLDAAMTLVPEGTGFGLLLSRDRKDCRADIWSDERTEERFFTGATPALALCIAALKARTPHP